MSWQPKKGDRVTWRGQPGVIEDDYWSHRDRFTVRFDDGSESNFGAACLRRLPTPPIINSVEG